MQRQYTPPEFQVRDTREFRQAQVAPADTRAAAPIQVGDVAWRDKLIESLSGTAANVLNKMADIEYSNLYLEGQSKAGLIESEDELEGNPLTRDWKVAGYRDTMGKLALADSEAQFSVDIAKLREKSPEDLQAYLTERRNKLMPGLAGMSREARAAAAGQLLLQDRAATKMYTTEHTKFIIEQKSQAVHTQWNTALRTLGNAQVKAALGELKPEDMHGQIQSTAGTMFGSVWMDQSLPRVVQQQLTFEMLHNALANDSVQFYEFVSQNAFPEADGSKTTLTARLTGDQQNKLAGAYREAMSRTRDTRNLFNMEQMASLEAQLDADAYTGSYNDLTSFLDPMVARNAISGDRRQNILQKYLGKQLKSEQSGALAEMYMRGDINGILSSGHSQKDGVEAMDAMLRKRGASPEQRLSAYLNTGLNGMEGGFQKAGEVLGVALRQVRSPDGTVLPQHLETVRTVNDALRRAEKNGQTGARVALLSGLSESDRLFAERVLAKRDAGATYDEAVRMATDTEVKEAQMSPSMRAAASQQTAQAVAKEIAEFNHTNFLQSVWTAIKMPFSEEAAADWKLRPESDFGFKSGWFSSGPTVQFYTQRVREELASEASNILLASPSADPASVLRVAKANVAARTIQSKHGPITLPRGVDIAVAFGIPGGHQAAIGPALDAMLKETKEDASWQIAFVNGRLFAQEFDRQGNRIGNGSFINPSDIKAKIKEQDDAKLAKADQTYGSGKFVRKGDSAVRFTGSNTAGVPMGWMFNFRNNLVTHEGVRDTPYADLSGKLDAKGSRIMTVGVGVSSHNPRYPKVGPDGKVSPEEIQRSFIEASNDAAITGARTQRAVGMHSQSSFMLFSELAYQSGEGFMTQKNDTGDSYRAFVGAMKQGNVTVAQEAFKRTAAWHHSGDPKDRSKVTPRQRSYLKLIELSMKGE